MATHSTVSLVVLTVDDPLTTSVFSMVNPDELSLYVFAPLTRPGAFDLTCKKIDGVALNAVGNVTVEPLA